jgi:flagellar basal body rod protein FlgG
MNSYWNGTSCVATTATTTTTPTPPVGGCGMNSYWNGNACVSTLNTPTPPVGGCGASFWDGTACVPTAPGSTPQTATIKCSDGTFRVTAIECPQSTNTGTQSGATTSQLIQCNDGTGQLSCEKNGGPAPAFRTCPDGTILPASTACANTTTKTSCNANEVSIGGKCVSNTSLPICTATQSTNCIPDTTTNTKYSCPTVGQVRDAGGNCFTPTATTQTATIKCADGTFRVTAIECGQGSSGSISGSGTQGQVIQCNDGTGQLSCEKNGGPKPTVGNTGFGGMNNSGVISQSATIKCSDGTFRVTAIECEQSVGGKSTVAITCPSNQIVAPSGSYCIYPTATGTAQGTYRSECAVTPLPASCLVGAPTTFEGATQKAQLATFNPVSTTDLKIQGNNAFDASGAKVGELAKSSNGQNFQAAAPPPPAAGGKAAPKKTTKTSTAPVIVMNVLGADNKEILGPDGKPLQTAPIVKQGNFVYTDSNGSPIMATPTLNAAGEAVVHNGKVLMTRLMTVGGNEAMLDSSGKPIMMVPLLGDDGKPLLAPNGEVLYAPPLVNAAGKTMMNETTGQAILSRPMADSSGNAALGADKKPFMGQPLLTKDNKLLTVGGQEIYTGAVGMPLTNSKKQQVQTANKQDVQFGFGGTLIDEGGNQVLGPDGKAIVMNANATPLMSNGLPLLDKNGKAVRVSANGQMTDSSGRAILGIDGKAIAIGKSEFADVMKVGSVIKSTVKAPDGSVAVMALNAQLFDKSGNPIVTASGQPIFFDAKSKKLIDPKGNAVKIAAGGKIVGKIASLAFQTVNFAA